MITPRVPSPPPPPASALVIAAQAASGPTGPRPLPAVLLALAGLALVLCIDGRTHALRVRATTLLNAATALLVILRGPGLVVPAPLCSQVEALGQLRTLRSELGDRGHRLPRWADMAGALDALVVDLEAAIAEGEPCPRADILVALGCAQEMLADHPHLSLGDALAHHGAGDFDLSEDVLGLSGAEAVEAIEQAKSEWRRSGEQDDVMRHVLGRLVEEWREEEGAFGLTVGAEVAA